MCVRGSGCGQREFDEGGRVFFFGGDNFFFFANTAPPHPRVCVCSTPCVFRSSRFGTMGRARRRRTSFFDYDAKRAHKK